MAKSTWRMERDGQWVKDIGGRTPPSGRPKVAGASANMAPSSTVVPCPHATLKVTVVRADTRKPIRGAAVQVIGPGLEQGQTDRAGLATFAKVLPGSYQVSVSIRSGKAVELIEPPTCPDVEVAPWSTHTVTIMVEPLTVNEVDEKDEDKREHRSCVTISLEKENGKPARHERFRIEFPDGTVKVERLNAEGEAWFGLTEQGDCKLTFLDLDDEAWEPISSVLPCRRKAALVGDKSAWIEISLAAEDGAPVPYERYSIKFDDGTVKGGTLDAEGRAGYDSVAPGQCHLSFPDLDDDAWKAI